MIPGMRIDSAMWRGLRSSVVLVAFVAALPLVQWCSPGANADPVHCPHRSMAARAASPACAGAMPACAAHGTQEGQCPFEPASGRTFCVGQALGGPGVRPHAPVLGAPVLLLALVPIAPMALEPALAAERVEAEPEARPPTESAARGPEVRAPPLA
jgi:hypothetical protein